MVIELALVYVAIGVIGFAHPDGTAEFGDFTWRGQWSVFRETFAAVIAWPLVLLR